MADQGIYVVVTIAPNGIVHAWGEGPAGPDPDEKTVPFATRADARRTADRFRREDAAYRLTRNPDRDGEVEPLLVKVCKVLGTESVPVEPDPEPASEVRETVSTSR